MLSTAITQTAWLDSPAMAKVVGHSNFKMSSIKTDKTMNKVRLSLEINEDLAKLLDDIADDEAVSRTEIVRRALAVIKTYKEQMDAGRSHIGFARRRLFRR